jgi:membrane protein implicated in regulation of membrane protease activity
MNFTENPQNIYFIAGSICLLIELGVLGMSGPLLFISIASFATGFMVLNGFIEQWGFGLLSIGVISLLSAIVLWKPLKNFQKRSDKIDDSSDMVGKHVMTVSEVSSISGEIRYSGLNWQARIDNGQAIQADSICKINRIDGNTLYIERLPE